MKTAMVRNLDLLVALAAFITVFIGVITMSMVNSNGVAVVQGLGLKDVMLVILGALVTLLTRPGPNTTMTSDGDTTTVTQGSVTVTPPDGETVIGG